MSRNVFILLIFSIFGLLVISCTLGQGEMAEYHKIRGDVFINTGDFDQAIADMDRAIEINPQMAMAFFLRGASLSQVGEILKAITDIELALELGLPTDMVEDVKE